MQFGCARHDQSVRAALAAYKERFVKSLPPAQQGRVDFGRPVFLAAAFYLITRKHKVQVSRLPARNRVNRNVCLTQAAARAPADSWLPALGLTAPCRWTA